MPPKRKRFRGGPSGPENLIKARWDIQKLTQGEEAPTAPGSQQERRPRGGLPNRKEQRKAARKNKKARKDAFYRHQKVPEVATTKQPEPKGGENKEGTGGQKKRVHFQLQVITDKAKKGESESDVEEETEEEDHRNKSIKALMEKIDKKTKLKAGRTQNKSKEQLIEENEEEDRIIKKLEKNLGYNKRKTKTIPMALKRDGFDYLLELCDEDTRKAAIFQDSDGEEDQPSDKRKRKASKNTTESDDDDDDDSDDDSDNDVENDSSEDNVEEDEDMEDIDDLHKALDELEEGEEDTDDDDSEEDGSDLNMEDVNKDYSSNEDNIEEDSESSDEEKTLPKPDPVKKLASTKSKKSDTQAATKVSKKEQKGKKKEKGAKDLRDESDVQTDKQKDTVTDEDEDKASGKRKEKSDIYGGAVARYIPPHERLQPPGDDEKRKVTLERLRKQVKGLINRLSEGNMHSIGKQFESLYASNSRNDMNDIVTSVLTEACLSTDPLPERLMMEHCMLLALLHNNVGAELGAHIVEFLARRFDSLHRKNDNRGEGKECDNVVAMFAHLYNFKLIHCILIYDIIRRLIDSFNERDIELVLGILRNVGFLIRKDDPAALKEVIQLISTKAAAASQDFREQSRVKFMLETIAALRNNNMKKMPNYDPAHLDHLQKLLRGMLRNKGSITDTQLRIPLEDLLSVEEKGRWWVVGSAWTGRGPGKGEEDGEGPAVKGEMSEKISELARKQRMNTDLRKNIFAVVMTSEDYMDAFEKLLQLQLKKSQEPEIIHVLLDCTMQERGYNPYYSYLAQKFCDFDRRFMMTIQFSLWDRFAVIDSLSSQNSSNLAQLVTHLLVTMAIPLSVLKKFEFAALEKPTVQFLRQILLALLLEREENTVQAIFTRVAKFPKLQQFRDGLRLFMSHFLMKKKSKMDNETAQKLRTRLRMAESTLLGTGSKTAI
ncbi:nucleolar MIF4G domain-containing protein 1-like [Branchiostoma lanceolatum]|uniref:nucleolar MIF4G domain-containing protein 1-like n=1 Tax=Branchiostoma lanceolatum TaxID=7740 RepID=UPI0034530696